MTMERTLQALLTQGIIDEVDFEFAATLVRIEADADSDALRLCAALVSQWLQRGHVCLDLAQLSIQDLQESSEGVALLPDIDIPEPEALDRFRSVGAAGDFVPLTRVGSRLYLTRYWQYEQQVLAAVRSRLLPVAVGAGSAEVDPLERFGPEAISVLQASAVRSALSRRFFILTGGPGTGKTATVAKLLCCLLERDLDTSFAVCAPTGKAAARLDESLGRQVESLGTTPEVRERLLDPEQRASTMHRLLGARGNSPYFRHDHQHPLPHQVVIVDEASMVDVAMMAKLVDALRDDAQLVLVGDKDQLASVEAGAVLGDLCQGVSSKSPDAAPLRDSICVLHENFRAKESPGIVAFAALLTREAAPSVQELRDCVDAHAAEVFWREGAGDVLEQEPDFAQSVREAWGALASVETPQEAFASLRQLQILAAVRAGPQGVVALNAAVKAVLGYAAMQQWYHGRPILVTRNDYALGLYNGDIGIAFHEDGRYFVWFESASGEYRRVAINRLPPHEPAYAITIHKSQGTEAERVLMILPERDNPILTRELVYTGATRAQRRLDLWASETMLQSAVSRRTLRVSGLGAELWDKI